MMNNEQHNPPVSAAHTDPFQSRVQPWMMACFGPEISADGAERNHRFLEESLELVQACGCTASEAHQLVDYVFGRPVGERAQEVGGVMVTLAALCLAQGLDMHAAGETELARIWTKVEAIRAKQAAKPKHSPLSAAAPQVVADEWGLPPLPEKHYEFTSPKTGWYTAAQMQAYARAALAAAPVQAQEPVARLEQELAVERAALADAVRHVSNLKERLAVAEKLPATTYSSTQATNCAGCGKHKHTPLRIDAMGGYVCLTCIDQKLGGLLGEFGCEDIAPVQPVAVPDADEAFKVAAQGCYFGNGDVARAAKEWFKAGYKAVPAAQGDAKDAARDAALEEAAKVCEGELLYPGDDAGVDGQLNEAIERIRALIGKPAPEVASAAIAAKAAS